VNKRCVAICRNSKCSNTFIRRVISKLRVPSCHTAPCVLYRGASNPTSKATNAQVAPGARLPMRTAVSCMIHHSRSHHNSTLRNEMLISWNRQQAVGGQVVWCPQKIMTVANNALHKNPNYSLKFLLLVSVFENI